MNFWSEKEKEKRGGGGEENVEFACGKGDGWESEELLLC